MEDCPTQKAPKTTQPRCDHIRINEALRASFSNEPVGCQMKRHQVFAQFSCEFQQWNPNSMQATEEVD
eukprot:4562779-Amphidinium_carterae.3